MNLLQLRIVAAVAFIALTGVLSAANRFVEAGFPAPDREWTGADYEAVVTVAAVG